MAQTLISTVGGAPIPLAITFGGTGTSATPSLVAGTGISISGTWPNQMVATSDAAAGTVNTVTAGGTTVSNPTAITFVGAIAAVSGAAAVVTITSSLAVGGSAGQIQYNSGGAVLAGINPSITPQGRLTLTSGSPVMTTNVTATSAIYYATYIGNLIPIGGQLYTIPGDQIQCTLDTTNHANAKLYDLFCMISTGAVTMVTGPAWTNNTTRSTTITLFSGVWTNGATITSAYNNAVAHTLITNAGTYVGTVYTTASGQTGMALVPTAVSGGSNNVLGLFNAYNRVPTHAEERDAATGWTYNGNGTWRAANGNANNRITYVDGLGVIAGTAHYDQAIHGDGTNQAQIGCKQNWTSGGPDYTALTATSAFVGIHAICSITGSLGLNFVQGIENTSSAASQSFNGNFTQLLMLDIPM